MNKDIKTLDPEIYELIILYGNDIINHVNMQTTKKYMQHGEISCYTHILAVAYFSVRIAKKLGWKVDYESLIRGALLHDYFLYDWRVREKQHRFHGFRHAKVALANASRDFTLNRIEEEIIVKHMFPLNIIPPTTKESLIVTIMDKVCATYELYAKNPYAKYNYFDCIK